MEFDVRKNEAIRRKGREASKIALAAWNDYIQAPLLEIKTYHEGGITTEEIANLLQVIGLGAISGGFN